MSKTSKTILFVILLTSIIFLSLFSIFIIGSQRKIEEIKKFESYQKQNPNLQMTWQRYFHPEYQFEFQYPSNLFNEKVSIVESEGIESDENYNHKIFSINTESISDVISLSIYESDNNQEITLSNIKNFDCGFMDCVDIKDRNNHFEEYEHLSYRTELGGDIKGENIVVIRNKILIARKIDNRNLFYLLTSKVSNDENTEKIFQSFQFSPNK